jgi:hypothetical protein
VLRVDDAELRARGGHGRACVADAGRLLQIVAAASGKGDDRIEEQEELPTWIAAHHKDFGEADVALARRAVERVLNNSELKDLWDDGGPENEWRPVVEELLRRLQNAGRGAAKKPAPKKPAR